jgi:hypothetical protein
MHQEDCGGTRKVRERDPRYNEQSDIDLDHKPQKKVKGVRVEKAAQFQAIA